MLRNSIVKVLVFLMVILASGCGRPVRQNGPSKELPGNTDPGSLGIKYAHCFKVARKPEGISLVLLDPWKPGTVFGKYLLINDSNQIKPVEGVIPIQIPVKEIAASSTTHAGFLTALGAGDLLIGCNNPERLYDSLLYKRYQSGSLVKMGRDLEYNLEFLIARKPSLVLQSGIEGQFNPDPRLTANSIPVLYVLEWLETTPLGRAEWIKVFGLLTGRMKQADSLFNIIENGYNSLASLGRNSSDKPEVFTGTDFKGTWYMPGGKNYMAVFFRDAGMEYPWASVDQSASLALSFEAVFKRCGNAPLWIGVPVDTLSRLLAMEQRYAGFRALRDKKVYSLTNRTNPHGGNDYWESGPVRPDRILEDLISIAHPELVPGHLCYYFRSLIFN